MLIACQQHGPKKIVADYHKALDDGNFKKAYNQLSTEARASMPLADFSEQASKYQKRDVKAATHAAIAPTSTEHYARVMTVAGPLMLVLTPEGWLLSENPLALYDQTHPVAAVHAFIRALNKKRYDKLFLLVPRSHRALVSEQSLATLLTDREDDVQRQILALRKALVFESEILGYRAIVKTDVGLSISLVLEDNLWRIADVRADF